VADVGPGNAAAAGDRTAGWCAPRGRDAAARNRNQGTVDGIAQVDDRTAPSELLVGHNPASKTLSRPPDRRPEQWESRGSIPASDAQAIELRRNLRPPPSVAGALQPTVE